MLSRTEEKAALLAFEQLAMICAKSPTTTLSTQTGICETCGAKNLKLVSKFWTVTDTYCGGCGSTWKDTPAPADSRSRSFGD